ncbi:MAG: hypothetical protein ABIY55_36130 [Kofleriaceae bacterium]
MEHFRVRPLTEADFDEIVRGAGGGRAHEDADARDRVGADYLVAGTLIELKSLDDEGLAKPERQAKLAGLFRRHQPDRPVIVLDRAALPEDAQRDYDRILEGPIKSAIAKANKQLRQSRTEHAASHSSVLLVINNGYTALDHSALLGMVAHRARQDTREIDGVVVAGCYFYSDTFESYFLWPIDYVPINVDRPFKSYEALRSAWNAFADRFMTKVVRGEMPAATIKGPVIDTQFDIDGVTYVKPAPPIGKKSHFFANGRPRKDSSELKHCPTVAQTFPDMTREEWHRFFATVPTDQWPGATYEAWMRRRSTAAAETDALKPFVPITVSHDAWLDWCRTNSTETTMSALVAYANDLFEQRVRSLFSEARERTRMGIVPSRYIVVATEQIGQDKANDVSHIAVMKEQASGEPVIRELITNARIFHEHALMLACAYAVSEHLDIVQWQVDLEYAWI